MENLALPFALCLLVVCAAQPFWYPRPKRRPLYISSKKDISDVEI